MRGAVSIYEIAPRITVTTGGRGMSYLILQNGRVFEGKRFGANKCARGELVFTTGMTGYLETLTDPSYFRQMVVMTFPLIGNYGVIPADFESNGPRLSAFIVRQWCDVPSNFRSISTLDEYMKQAGIPGMCDVDTRELTRVLRSAGVMNAAIEDELPSDMDAFLKDLGNETPIGGVMDVTCDAFSIETIANPLRRVAIWNYGAKGGVERNLHARGCETVDVPAWATMEQILSYKPDGILLSNGPGDPAVNTGIIEEMGRLAATGIPIFGICLGHQLLALSQGGSTEKLKFGHRGANQPVRDTKMNRYYITSQNHGYAVSHSNLPKGASARFVNANDGTIEGIDYTEINAFTVQFHPEACGGPLDTGFLFDTFMKRMGG